MAQDRNQDRHRDKQGGSIVPPLQHAMEAQLYTVSVQTVGKYFINAEQLQ